MFVCFSQENCSNDFIHYQAVFPPFVFKTTQTHDCLAPECNGEKRPMASKKEYKKTGSAGSCRQCKVWALLLAKGLPELHRTVTGPVSWLILPLSQLGGHEGTFSPVTCLTADGLLSQGGREYTQRPWSGAKRILFILHLLHWSFLSTNQPQQEIAMKSTHHAQSPLPWESSITCRMAEKESQGMNVNFSQCFL